MDRESVATGRSLRRAQRGSGDQVRAAEDAVAGDGAVLRVLVPHHVRHVRRDDLRHSIPRRFLLRHHSTRHPGQELRITSNLWLKDSGCNGTLFSPLFPYLDVMGPRFLWRISPTFLQVYISEISHPSIRGSLCSASRVLSHIGLLSSFALGAWLDWRQLALVCAGSPLMLLITAR